MLHHGPETNRNRTRLLNCLPRTSLARNLGNQFA